MKDLIGLSNWLAFYVKIQTEIANFGRKFGQNFIAIIAIVVIVNCDRSLEEA